MVEHADQADALGHRDDLVGMRDAAVGALHAHQAFVEGDVAAFRLDHRLEGERDAPLVERGDDLVGRAHAVAPHGVALDVRPVGDEGAVALGARGMQRVERAREDFRHRAGVARRGHAADGHRHRHRAGGGRDGLVAHAGEQPLGGDRQFVGGAARQDDAELVAGEAAEMVLAAQPRADALGDLGDHLLGGVEAVGFVEAAEMIDRHQQEAAGAAEAHRRFERGGERLGELRAVHLAGERIEFGELDEPLLALVPRIDRAHHAMRAQRLAVGTGEPAAGVFQPGLLAVSARLKAYCT